MTATDKTFKNLRSAVNQGKVISNSLSHLAILWWRDFATMLLEFRTGTESRFVRLIPDTQGNLLLSMVFGGKRELPTTLNHSFKVIGMQHVMAASGFNVGLISALTQQLTSRFWGRRTRGIFTLIGILMYVELAGATASVVRAGCMLGFSLFLSQCCYRQVNPLRMLMFTAIIMVLCKPEFLEDIGWQLSVASTLGLILVTPLLTASSLRNEIELQGVVEKREEGSPRGMVVSVIKDAALTTIAAQSLSLPLLLHHFGELSLLSIPANSLLLWMTPWLTLGGVWLWILEVFSQVMAGLLDPWLRVFGQGLYLAMSVFIALVSWLGAWDWTLIELDPWPWWSVCLWWFCVACILVKSKKGTRV